MSFLFPKNKICSFILILLVAIIFATILTWPFATKLTTFYIDSGDYAFNGSMLFYNQSALRTGEIFNQKEYMNGYQFYPQPYTLAYSDHLFLPSLIFSPIYWLTNKFILSVNLLLFISFVLSFVFAYYFLHHFTQNKYASIIGAFVYSFNPKIFAHFPIHLSLLSHYFLPFVFLTLYKFLVKPNFKNAFLFGFGFTLNGLTAVYFQLLSIFILPFFAIPFLINNFLHKNKDYFLNLTRSSIIILVFIPILLHFNLPYLEFSKKEFAVRKLEETFFFSGRLINWFFANPDSLVYGNFVKKYEKIRSPGIDSIDGKFNYPEQTLFLNILPVILFILGLLYLYKKSLKKSLNYKIFLILLAFTLILFVVFILSFGPYFFGWNGKGPYWTLPFYYLYKSFSLFQAIRVPNRLQLIFYVPFIFFVSYGIVYLSSKLKKRFLTLILFLIFIIILLIENLHLRSYDKKSALLEKQTQEKFNLKQLKFLEGKKVLHLPIHIPELGEMSTYTLDWQIISNAKSLNGYSGYVPPNQLKFLINLKEKLDEDALKKLSIINTDYIIIHKDLLGKEAEKYKDFNKIYEKIIIYNKNGFIIFDLKKYPFEFNKCNLEKDIQIDLKMASSKTNNQNFYALLLKNKSNCYLPSIYLNKYKERKFSVNNLYGEKINLNFHFKLPPVIEPYQEIVLSEMDNELRVE